MLNLPLYSQKKLLLSFEYAIVLYDVAKMNGVELTPELIERTQSMIIKEFTKNSPTRIAVNMIPNLLAMFETN